MDEDDRLIKYWERIFAGHKLCRTCKKPWPGRCCDCKDNIDLGSQRFVEDDKGNKHLLCQMCLVEMLMNMVREDL